MSAFIIPSCIVWKVHTRYPAPDGISLIPKEMTMSYADKLIYKLHSTIRAHSTCDVIH